MFSEDLWWISLGEKYSSLERNTSSQRRTYAMHTHKCTCAHRYSHRYAYGNFKKSSHFIMFMYFVAIFLFLGLWIVIVASFLLTDFVSFVGDVFTYGTIKISSTNNVCKHIYRRILFGLENLMELAPSAAHKYHRTKVRMCMQR